MTTSTNDGMYNFKMHINVTIQDRVKFHNVAPGIGFNDKISYSYRTTGITAKFLGESMFKQRGKNYLEHNVRIS